MKTQLNSDEADRARFQRRYEEPGRFLGSREIYNEVAIRLTAKECATQNAARRLRGRHVVARPDWDLLNRAKRRLKRQTANVE